MAVAKVITDLSLDRTFDYLIPPPLAGKVKVGSRVKIPFGKSLRSGYVVSLVDFSPFPDLKPIAELAECRSGIPENLLVLGRWMAEYYCCAQEQAMRTLLPGAVRHGKIKVKTRKTFTAGEAAEHFIAANADKKNCEKRIAVLKLLLAEGEKDIDELINRSGAGASVLKTLLRDALIVEGSMEIRRDHYSKAKVVPSTPMEPTAEQASALAKIRKMMDNPGSSPHVALLYGVTNSGKTEVYLQSIAHALEQGRDSIVLVPEISLTPQTVRRFRSRFGDQVSVLHSRLTDAERFDEFMRIRNGEVKIAVGARSALFAPFENPGLIIVDEEHESSYKQSEAPRYNARDVAVMRGKLEKAVVLLGSATPSAESFYNAQQGKYKLLSMPHRVDNKVLPIIEVVDQRLGREAGKSSLFSPVLVSAVYDRLKKGEQSILFLNRRGYAREMSCELCGYVASCPDCAVSYTYSKLRQTLSCHYCGSVVLAPTICPGCGSPAIRYTGSGTEKVENIAGQLFKGARIARMDSDSMRSTNDYEKVLDNFRRGAIDILIGTQMIAKGLHFPNVTLVGILNADQNLKMPDFRAPERTFQLITQVAGRAGRGDVPGEVIVQTFDPENDTIAAAVKYDYEGFYRYDMEVRELLCYPPYSHLISVVFRSPEEKSCMEYAEKFKSELQGFLHDEVKLTGPSPAPIERIKGKYRYILIIRGSKLKQLKQKMRSMIVGRMPKDLDVAIDVDALSML